MLTEMRGRRLGGPPHIDTPETNINVPTAQLAATGTPEIYWRAGGVSGHGEICSEKVINDIRALSILIPPIAVPVPKPYNRLSLVHGFVGSALKSSTGRIV